MIKALLFTSVLYTSLTTAIADVFYVEEIVNRGIGLKKTGARKTVNKVYIKGQRQRIRSQIETSKKGAKALRHKGMVIDGSTILQLDQLQLIKIDHTEHVFSQEPLPPPKKLKAANSDMYPRTGKKSSLSPADPDRKIKFRTRVFEDTTRVAGVLCRRFAAEMTARHYKPGTKMIRRENRYLYQAWIADGFPGYRDLEYFQEIQERKTSFPSFLRGGIGVRVQTEIADYDKLRQEINTFGGFHMQSVLKVFTTQGGQKEKSVFALTRTVKSISNSDLPDSLFDVSGESMRKNQ